MVAPVAATGEFSLPDLEFEITSPGASGLDLHPPGTTLVPDRGIYDELGRDLGVLLAIDLAAEGGALQGVRAKVEDGGDKRVELAVGKRTRMR